MPLLSEAGELQSCNALSPRCVFILGFARSCTTITLQLLNTAPAALILGEANLYLPKDAPRWREWYNAQHQSYGNQETKSSYAPDFTGNRDHTWWEWLAAASSHYAVLGDKMAFTSIHFGCVAPAAIKCFFESRFFEARYVFLFREPIDTLLSAASLLGIKDDVGIRRECCAWLRYVKLWADWIRTFPHTLTLVAEDFGMATVNALTSFIGLDYTGADVLLHNDNRRRYVAAEPYHSLVFLKKELEDIYGLVKTAINDDPRLWQAEQKRIFVPVLDPHQGVERTQCVPRPLGQAWARAEALLTVIDRGERVSEG